jgi:beta-lactamase class A
MNMYRRAFFILATVSAVLLPAAARAADMGPLSTLRLELINEERITSGTVGIAVRDLATGMTSGINLDSVMPAASTIKVPVMVEVFRQMSLGRFDLQQQVTLLARDRDWGSGDLCDAAPGTRYSVSSLLRVMIDESDNTATNMLIRLVGRDNVNTTMKSLGLHHTFLKTDVRTATENVRFALRTTPHDMVSLMDLLAHDQLVDPWSSRAMISILTAQQHNGLLPAPLPKGTSIAHKTGSLHDTLNDVGIVYHDEEPYAIAVMTTHWSTLATGRVFIHRISRMAYQTFSEFAHWRELEGLPAFQPDLANLSDPIGPAAQQQPAAAVPASGLPAEQLAPPPEAVSAGDDT